MGNGESDNLGGPARSASPTGGAETRHTDSATDPTAISRRGLLTGTLATGVAMAAFSRGRIALGDTDPSAPGTLQGPEGLRVEVRPYGGSPTDVAGIQAELERTVLSGELTQGRYRWLRFRRDDAQRTAGMPAAPQAFTAEVYDYANSRTLDLSGRLERPERARLQISDRQPLPISEEFDEAVALLEADSKWGPELRSGDVLPYRPMPPLLEDEHGHRVVAVGLYAPGGGLDTTVHRLVGADLDAREPAEEQPLHASHADCDAPLPEDDCEEGERTGQAEIVVSRHGEELWRLVVVRPAESSGTNGSGVELRHVSYQGRSVLHRAHVPILNVDYGLANDHGCGPAYRDWINEESCFVARGSDVTDGIRLCGTTPETILDTGSDAGNFRGVAIHVDRNEVVLTSEVRAGWYRYITEWRLVDNGDIIPRFGFSAVSNPCTCQHHVHHAYWRYDWAVDGLDDNRIEEYNELGLDGLPAWRTLAVEEAPDRDDERRRRWRVTNRSTGAGYLLEPGWEDAVSDLWGAGDAWLLRYDPTEIDDGQGFTSSWPRARARLDLFADGEPVDGHDVVSWYAGHWGHLPGAAGDWVGPRLRRVDIAG